MTRLSRAPAVLALSAGTLVYEVLLVRVFAIEQFHHFASMAVGVAMLGLGAAGTLCTLAPRWRAGAHGLFVPAALLAALALAASPLAAAQIRVDATALAWDPGQWARLGGLYLVLAIPFGMVALATLGALAEAAEAPGAVYGASLAGAGMGAVAALAALGLLPPVRALAVPGLLGAVGAVLAAVSARHRRGALALATAVALLGGVFLARPPWRLHLLPYKGLPQVLAYPDARIVAEHANPVGWVVAAEAPAFRYAPGLSLSYRGGFPPQTALFADGELVGAVGRWTESTARLLEWQPSALPYALGGRRRVLVIGSGGGHEVASAIRHGATGITVIELQPAVVEQAAGVSGENGLARVRWVVGSARDFVARAQERFDLVTLGPVGGTGAGTGARTLAEDYDHTVEAYARYLALLDAGGVLAVTGWLAEPPRTNVRVILTAVEALRRVAPLRVATGLVVVRSWGTVTTVVKPDGFTEPELFALESWAAERRFDVDWRPGLETPSSRFNLVERPTLFEAAAAAVDGGESARRFVAENPFDVRPATDARPFPYHFVGVRAIRWLADRPRGDWLAFADWGHIALLGTLAQSGLLAALLMLGPVAARAGKPAGGRQGRLLGYFAAIGLGYLAAEIAAIQQFTLLLGHPVYAVAAVLAGVLVLSGIGSAFSDRVALRAGRLVPGLLAVGFAGYAAILLPLIQLAQPAPLPVRASVAVLALAPVALLMGLPFPVGLRTLAGSEPTRLAWAWAANGFASVIAAPLAALIALEAGTPAGFLVAAAGYGTAFALAWDRGGRIDFSRAAPRPPETASPPPLVEE